MGLPAGYKQIAYIESTGTQYIDTGFEPNSNTRIVADTEVTKGATSFLFGARANSSANASSSSFSMPQISGTSLRSDYGSAETEIAVSPVQKLIIDKNKNNTTVNGTTVSATAQTFQCNYALTLLTVNTAGTINSTKTAAKIYSCQIYDNGTLVRDYIPCLNDSGVAGLYDLANAEFYGDAAGGSFTAGPEIGLLAPNDFVAFSSEEAISLSWSKVNGADGYILRRNGLQIANTTETEYTDNMAKPYRIYTYEVSAYDEENESEAATLTASVLESESFLTVDNRTAADVERVKSLQNRIKSGKATNEEIIEWLDGMLGAYNAADMNRVESAVDYLQTYLNGVQAALDAYRAERMVASDAFWVVPWNAFSLVTKKDWVLEDIPGESDLARYLSNVDEVTNAIAIAKKLPKTMNLLDYTGANEIERVLRVEYDEGMAYENNAKRLIDNTQAAFVYSGEFYGGEF